MADTITVNSNLQDLIINTNSMSNIYYVTSTDFLIFKSEIGQYVYNEDDFLNLKKDVSALTDYIMNINLSGYNRFNQDNYYKIIKYIDSTGIAQTSGKLTIDLSNFIQKNQLYYEGKSLGNSILNIDDNLVRLKNITINGGNSITGNLKYDLITYDKLSAYQDDYFKRFHNQMSAYVSTLIFQNSIFQERLLNKYFTSCTSSVVFQGGTISESYNVNPLDKSRQISISGIPVELIKGTSPVQIENLNASKVSGFNGTSETINLQDRYSDVKDIISGVVPDFDLTSINSTIEYSTDNLLHAVHNIDANLICLKYLSQAYGSSLPSAWVDNANFWCKTYTNGWIEQGGITTINNTTQTINFPHTMSNTNYMVLYSLFDSLNYHVKSINRTTTGMNVTIDTGGVVFSWYIIGKQDKEKQ